MITTTKLKLTTDYNQIYILLKTMLWIDQLEDYQDELVKLEDEINFESKPERIKELQARRDEIINVLSRDKEDRRFYFNY